MVEFATSAAQMDQDQQEAYLHVEGLCKSFAGQVLYDNFHLSLAKGKFISVFGPNGCGKSTLINMVSGLIPCDRGRISVAGLPINRAQIGYVFQNYRDSLFPWISAFDNIAYPLKVNGLSTRECKLKVEELLNTFDINLDLKRYPYQFSGGQQQLIAILRAIVAQPDILFLDEPFSALDFEMTLYVREKLQAVFLESGLTTVIVSHDLEDAVYLADQVLLLSKRPTYLVESVTFNSPRPRTPDTLSDSEFIRVKSHCLDIFRQEMRK
ncbi:ABC transporter ATP-binding protein [Leptolyngbya sp. NK1-12]|nr:ABC transporter ATP-binding protein [Leptolyngbya sp. NK1-12]